jgi:outer membrane protein TolC
MSLRSSALLLFALGISSAAMAAPEEISLSDAIGRALQQNGELKAQRLQEKQAAADVDRVGGEFGPRLEALVGIGPITQAYGDSTKVVEDKTKFGRMILGQFTFTYPLYTWSRKSDYEKAAEAGVRVKVAESKLKENDVRFAVKEAYYGYQFANSMRDFIQSGKAELAKALEGKKKKAGEKEDFKMQIFFTQVQSREAEVQKFYDLAIEGLALRMGAPRGTVTPKDAWLSPEVRELKPVEHYVALAGGRPEFRQLSEGIFAKRSLAKGERKALLPMFALLAGFDGANTNVRNRQPGPFVFDPYNRQQWSLGVGFKLDFQWSLAHAKADRLNAEAEELEAKDIFAHQGIETEVRKAYLELVEAETRLKAAKEGYNTGKKWLTGEAMNYGSGLSSSGTKGLVEAFGARAETTKDYFEAVHRYQMAWATLSKVVGSEVDPLLEPASGT